MNALIIDDDKIVRLLAGKMLESKGFTVLSLSSEEEVKEYLLDKSKIPKTDLILLDLQIGTCTGKIMYEHLRGNFEPFPKLIFMSSHSEEDAKGLDLMNSEGNSFLQKPFQAGDLYEKLSGLGLI
jgi:DNA-binding response OmpR family regulator